MDPSRQFSPLPSSVCAPGSCHQGAWYPLSSERLPLTETGCRGVQPLWPYSIPYLLLEVSYGQGTELAFARCKVTQGSCPQTACGPVEETGHPPCSPRGDIKCWWMGTKRLEVTGGIVSFSWNGQESLTGEGASVPGLQAQVGLDTYLLGRGRAKEAESGMEAVSCMRKEKQGV